MTVTIKVTNQDTLNLLRNMENLGLIHMLTDTSPDIHKADEEEKYSHRKLRGIHKNLPGASVDEFLARCYADKERELAMEKHHA